MQSLVPLEPPSSRYFVAASINDSNLVQTTIGVVKLNCVLLELPLIRVENIMWMAIRQRRTGLYIEITFYDGLKTSFPDGKSPNLIHKSTC